MNRLPSRRFSPAAFLLAASLLALPPAALAGGADAPPPVIPAPKKLHTTQWAFDVDWYVYILVSSKATRGTRRAARIVQLGLRKRLELDAPIVRITQRGGLSPRSRAIWVIEPRLDRPPARTIGVEGLDFSPPMLDDGYFIRVDALETVIHGATDAGSCHGAQTLLQLILPARPGGLLRKARPPRIPCLWMADWPSRPTRPLPLGVKLPAKRPRLQDFVQALARYKLNAVHTSALPDADPAKAAFRDYAARYAVRAVDAVAGLPQEPLTKMARPWLKEGPAAVYGLAALGEATWADPEADVEEFRRRFARLTFRNEEAAEALRLTEEYLADRAPQRPSALLDRVAALAKAPDAEARRKHERRAQRIRALWSDVEERPDLRDAFLDVAEREIAAWDVLYALADARRLAEKGRFGPAANHLRERLADLRKRGGLSEAVEGKIAALADRLDSAADAESPPPLEQLWPAN